MDHHPLHLHSSMKVILADQRMSSLVILLAVERYLIVGGDNCSASEDYAVFLAVCYNYLRNLIVAAR